MKITLQRWVPFPTAFQLGLRHREPDSTVLVLTFCFLCWHKCLLSGEERKQVSSRRPRDGMPGKDVHIWNTFETPTGIQNTASLSSEEKLDTRPSRQTTHGHHVPLKLPSRHTFPICSGRLQAAWKNLPSGHRMPILIVQKVQNPMEAFDWVVLFPPTSCPFLPRISKVGSGKARRGNPASNGRCWHSTSLIIYTWWAHVQV